MCYSNKKKAREYSSIYEKTVDQTMEAWMKEIGLVMNIQELGVTEDMLEGIANGSFIMEGGYKTLTHGEIVEILKNSMK